MESKDIYRFVLIALQMYRYDPSNMCFNFVLNIAVGFIVILVPAYGFHQCYSCTNFTHPDECIIIKKCADNEVCFVESHVNSTGHVMYNLGCMMKQQCPGIVPPRSAGKRIAGTTLCNVCCEEDFCNADLCDHHYDHSKDGQVCLNCDNVGNIQDCLKIKRCEFNEMCYAQARPSGYKLGCVRKADCSHTLSPGVVIGKRTSSLSGCRECCNGENCNIHLCSKRPSEYKLMVDKLSENRSSCEDNSYQSCQYMLNVLKLKCSDDNVQALCPKSCGLCDIDSCQDNVTFNCAEVGRYFNICTSENAYTYCRKYCNLCDGNVQNNLTTDRPADCLAVEILGKRKSGIYKIYPNHLVYPNGIMVYCDMDSLGGGWTVIQRRINGSLHFDKTWQEYKNGFGDPHGEYWLGNDALYVLTYGKNRTLLIKLLDSKSGAVWKYAQYLGMHVGNETNKYKLTFIEGSYSGTAGDHLNEHGPGDHNNMKFSTKDRDNDKGRSRSCANQLNGGWWFNDCEYGCLNCQYLGTDSYWGPIHFKSTFIMIR